MRDALSYSPQVTCYGEGDRGAEPSGRHSLGTVQRNRRTRTLSIMEKHDNFASYTNGRLLGLGAS